MKIQHGQRVLFVGDSITDCGRARPIGEGLIPQGGGLGNGYVSVISALVNVKFPSLRPRFTNVGQSGSTVRGVKERWQAEVVDLKPDWLSIMIGTNDVWRQFDLKPAPEAAVPLDEYEETLRELLKHRPASLKGTVLMTPFFIESNRADAMRKRMDEYSAVVQKIAADMGTLFVDTQAAFDRILEHQHSMELAWDRVHPSPTGHAAIAKAWLDVMGFHW